MLRALFFDLDNTLLDRASTFKRYAVAQMKQRGIPVHARAAVLAKLVACDRVHQHCEFKEYAAVMAAHTPEMGLSAEQYYSEYVPGLLAAIEPAPDICAMVQRLSASWKVALVTNGGSERQRDKLKRMGLDACFAREAIFVSEEVGAPKPKPLIFSRALAWSGCAASETLFIGDDPERDIGGAAALGMATCWVYGVHESEIYPANFPQPDWRIERVDEIEPLLAGMRRSPATGGW